MKALGVVVVLEALFLGLILALYLNRESAPTTFPSVVAVQAPAASASSVAVSFPAPIVGRTKHVVLTSRGGRANAVQP
jgi:predicted branched-subunit amino acid permease